MAIAKESIKEGWYWIRSRKNGNLSIVQVGKIRSDLAVFHHGWEVLDPLEHACAEFDFIDRVNPMPR